MKKKFIEYYYGRGAGRGNAAQQKQSMKDEMKNLRRRNEKVNDSMEEDEDVWVEEQSGAGWQEFLQATKLCDTDTGR